jgi:hypothetical protein
MLERKASPSSNSEGRSPFPPNNLCFQERSSVERVTLLRGPFGPLGSLFNQRDLTLPDCVPTQHGHALSYSFILHPPSSTIGPLRPSPPRLPWIPMPSPEMEPRVMLPIIALSSYTRLLHNPPYLKCLLAPWCRGCSARTSVEVAAGFQSWKQNTERPKRATTHEAVFCGH